MAAAIRAADFGRRVCLIEETKRFGGVDIWSGTLPSKTLWEMAKFRRYLQGNTSGRFLEKLKPLPNSYDDSHIQSVLSEASVMRESQIRRQLIASQVTMLHGRATFADPHHLHVSPAAESNASHTLVEASHFVIATGSQPLAHPNLPYDGERIVSSDDIMFLPIPRKLVVIGGGVVGIEFASIYSSFGVTDITLVEENSRILHKEDEDVAAFVGGLLEAKGRIRFLWNATNIRLSGNPAASGVRLVVDSSSNEPTDAVRREEVDADRVLVAVGRGPRIDNLGLDNLGLLPTSKSHAERDQFFQLRPHHHIYICGDCASKRMQTNVAEYEGRAAVEHIYSARSRDEIRHLQRLKNFSTISFFDQEVAAVGMNERKCRARGIRHIVATYGYEFVSRAIAIGNTRGFVKIITSDDDEKIVLGVRVVGPQAGTVVEMASRVVRQQQSVYSLLETQCAYPAVMQGFQQCALLCVGKSTLKPGVFPQLTLRRWPPSTDSVFY